MTKRHEHTCDCCFPRKDSVVIEFDPSTEKAIGVVDRLGYLRCLRCWKAKMIEDDTVVMPLGASRVHKDSKPHCDEPCDTCGHVVADVASGILKVENDGEEWETTVAEFCRDNETDSILAAGVRSLEPGQSIFGGGGAAPSFRLTRLETS